eukprot:GHVU01050252.1.p2 GENE.GHVU01050252.1~~GHVU01050252.1.p2  ORF type:complete len:168 (-),score=10.76 GHVU01050252.1:2147-2650(-)
MEVERAEFAGDVFLSGQTMGDNKIEAVLIFAHCLVLVLADCFQPLSKWLVFLPDGSHHRQSMRACETAYGDLRTGNLSKTVSALAWLSFRHYFATNNNLQRGGPQCVAQQQAPLCSARMATRDSTNSPMADAPLRDQKIRCQSSLLIEFPRAPIQAAGIAFLLTHII